MVETRTKELVHAEMPRPVHEVTKVEGHVCLRGMFGTETAHAARTARTSVRSITTSRKYRNIRVGERETASKRASGRKREKVRVTAWARIL